MATFYAGQTDYIDKLNTLAADSTASLAAASAAAISEDNAAASAVTAATQAGLANTATVNMQSLFNRLYLGV